MGDKAVCEGPRFTVLPVPYDLTATYGAGARRGPAAILEASANMELYDEETETEPVAAGILTLAPLEVRADGPEMMVRRVEAAVGEILEGGSMPVVLGGEHSITTGTVRALFARCPGLSVLHLDAHADLRGEYQGTPFSHASVARRISEHCPLVQAGIRSLSAEEAEFMRGSGGAGITTIFADRMTGPAGLEEAIDRMTAALTDDVFITIDLDVLDPSVMPSTGTPEPGGLGWREVLEILREVTGLKRIRGFDVVELAPIPGLHAPDFLAARLVYKIMAYLTADRAS
jgi:agmatinase